MAAPTQAGYLDIVVKSALGGVLIAALLSLARLRQYVITGLLVSMPVISLYTWWWLGTEHGADSLRTALRAAMLSAIPWVAYLGVVYLLAGRMPLWLALASGWLVWLVIAVVFWLVLQANA
jgi:uncharacterized membrane protein (GlpM family)